jgi:hypothetical protein
MANSTVTALVTSIATVALDATQINVYQDEVIFDLARLAQPRSIIQTGASFVAAVKGQAVYDLPTADGARTALLLIYDETQLALARYDEAMMFNEAWRSKEDRPIAYINDTINRTQFGVVPTPSLDGEAIALTPLDFVTWPGSNFTVIYAKSDTAYAGTNLTDTYLALAFEVLARELGRDSDHKDPEAAAMAKALATVFWQLSFPEME